MARVQVLFAVLLALSVSACSVQPLHVSEGQYAGIQMQLNYAAPKSRLEQVAYNTIAARIGQAEGNAPVLSLTATTSERSIGKTLTPVDIDGDPATPETTKEGPFATPQTEVTARVAATVTSPSGEVLFTETRTGSTSYYTVGNALADDVAREAAAENATKTAAEFIRLQLLVWGRGFNADR